ncbi:MAG: TetR/AcrR family transcriptional regulator [Intestinibacter sp.]|uniref:TetR/AcrR family transcriptional regulator n=1 Tax=Intestinibacter sp. TaxID=1965304 RepID=UPI003F15D97B
MKNTKENILLTALRLFAKDGYEAVSVSQISGELGMTKSALYKHYKNKRDIFDSIVERMDQLDYERAKRYKIPEGTVEEIVTEYKHMTIDKIKIYSEAQFKHWTEEEFSSLFRKMLTLEQYRSQEMSELYQKYLVEGPVEYMKDLFYNMTGNSSEAEQFALEFYGPIFLMYSLYDRGKNKDEILEMLRVHIERFSKQIEGEGK